MRKFLLFFCSIFGFINSSQSQNRNISFENSDLDWELVDDLLKNHIKNKTKFMEGIKDFESILNVGGLELINSLELEKLNEEFNDFIVQTIIKNEIPPNLKAINIGLFTSIEKNKESITLYLSGSDISLIDDSFDWNVEPIYFPKFYFTPTYFEMIKNTNTNIDANLEILLFNGILNLLIINNVDLLKSNFLKNNNELYLGSGFDSGDTYILGLLSKKGLN